MEPDTFFGYERVSPETKTSKVREVFDSVAPRYDLMNDLMSFGMHRLWKRFAVAMLDPRANHRVLDLAGGTGDLARLVHRRTRGKAKITVCDINAHMLGLGRDRSIDGGVVAGIDYVVGSAESLPFDNGSFDRLIIGFGLRNVTNKASALAEMYRVIPVGGRAVVLEFSTMKTPLLSRAYDAYSFRALPVLGRLVAGDPDSYRYLAESIRVHPDQDALRFMMEAAGFDRVRCHDLCGGAVAVHVGWKS